MDDTTSPQGSGDGRVDNLDLGSLILEAPGFLLAVIDQNNRLARTNANLEKTSGFSSQELRGKRLQSLVLEPLAEVLKRARASGMAEEMVTGLNQADGETIRVRWRFTALPEPAGWVMAVGAVLPGAGEPAGPIPTQVAFLKKLLATEAGFVHVYDLEQGRFVYSNHSLADFMSHSPDRLPKEGGDLFQALLHPDDAAPLGAYLEELKNAPEGQIREIEYRLRHADNSYHWILNRATPYSRDPAGRVRQVMGIAQDITPHRTAEELHLRLVEIVETTPDVIATIRPDGTLVYMNWAGRELLGLRLQDVIGYSLRNFTPPDVTEHILHESIPAAVRDGSWTGEATLTGEDGEDVAVSLVLVAHPTESDEVAYLSFIARDMREPRRMEGELRRSRDELELRVAERTAELHRSEELYRTLAESAPDMIYVLSRDGQIEYINHAAAVLFNRPVEELLGRFITELYPVETALEEQRRVLEVCTSGSLQAYENKIHFPGGDRWLSTILAPIRSPDGSVDAVLGVSRDVTARKQIEDELFQSRHMLQLILDNIPQRVFWKDSDSRFLGGNRPFLQDAGLESLEQLLGKDDYALQWAANAEQYRADDRQVMESGQEKLNYEEPQTKQAGEAFWLRTSKIPLRDRDGKVFGVLGSYEDITERKHAEMLLDASNKELTRSNADLEQFAYIASH
ncbi:MAG TPA: PAS domain S-box protein, partial [Anaerolinea sp.]|nr:PAS domain S-box protein [Anaerolinea sp.]